MPDPIQERLRIMEREQPSQNAHPQSLRKSLADMLYFSDRSGKVDTVPQITSHIPEGCYMLLEYLRVPSWFIDPEGDHHSYHNILLMATYDECVKQWGSKAKDFLLGDPYRELGTIVANRERIGQVPTNSAFVWAGIYGRF